MLWREDLTAIERERTRQAEEREREEQQQARQIQEPLFDQVDRPEPALGDFLYVHF